VVAVSLKKSSLGLAAAIIQPTSHHLERRLLTAVTLVIMTGLAAATTWFATSSLRQSSPPPPTVHLVIPSETDTYKYATDMTVSPDGTQVAFIAQRHDGTDVSDEQRLWVRRLDDFDARELDAEASSELFWSHDSRYIGFLADGGLWSIRTDGADKRLLTALEGANGMTWNAQGEIVVAREGRGIRILRPGATSLEELTSVANRTLVTVHMHPHFLPDGNRYLYLEVTFDPEKEFRSRMLYAGNLATGEQTRIGPFPSGAWYVEPGHLLYVEDGTVKSVPFDAEKLNITGEPIVLAQGAFYFKPVGAASMSVSRGGVVVFNPVQARRALAWFDTGGNRLGQAGAPAIYDDNFRISPDGQTVATGIENVQTQQSDVVLLSLQRDTARRLTFDARWEGAPVWSRDGKTIYLSTDHHGPPAVYSLKTSGDATNREIFRETGVWFPTDVSPDGRFLALMGRHPSTGYDLWMVPLDGEEKPFAFNSMRGNQLDARFSPDGARIAYVSGETGSREIFVDTFPDPSGGVQVSLHGGSSPVWSPDGRKLYFGQSPTGDRDWAVMVVEFSDSDPPSPLPPEVLFKPGPFEGFDLAPDGERFLLRIIPDGTPDNHVILNWIEALETAGTEDSR
jgi:Tol biopolymer transport system component